MVSFTDQNGNSSGDPEFVQPKPMGIQVESRDEILQRLNFERLVANNVAEVRKVTAKTVLSIMGIILLGAVVLRAVMALFSINF